MRDAMEFWNSMNNEIRKLFKEQQVPTMDAVISLYQFSHAIYELLSKEEKEALKVGAKDSSGLNHGLQVYEAINRIVLNEHKKDLESLNN